MNLSSTSTTLCPRLPRHFLGWWRSAAVCIVGLATGMAQPVATADGFALPQPGHRFEFPRDHGAHPEFKLEWWYVTGHLYDESKRRYGFQATFFRQTAPDRSTELHLAHMALLDVAEGRFLHQERLNRDGWDASAQRVTLEVRNGPWSLRRADGPRDVMELAGGIRSDVNFRLSLTPSKPLVVFGENGVSRKGDDPTAASYYLTFSRLQVTGELTLGAGVPRRVSGEAWMDHEISSSQLSANQVGWDWISIQLRDEPRELMLYRLRRADGSEDPASTLQWVSPESRPQRSPHAWEVLSTWKSPATGAVYPSRIRLTTKDPQSGENRTFILEPLKSAQELTGDLAGIAYWEGACRVLDDRQREIGSAYMELTGYARALKL
jgi:predicted secreted hydrolase